MKIGILASGNLGFTTIQLIFKIHPIEFILTDSGSDLIIQYAEKENISLFKGNPRNGKTKDFLNNYPCDVIISINYLFLIENDIILHPKVLAFNIHGSLLPKYRGRTPHVWSIINNEIKSGITAHLIDTSCDAGKIIEQIIVPIEKDDTGASVLAKYENHYYPLIASVLNRIKANDFNFTAQDHTKATFFGKRTPKDGEIKWEWEKERIYNWVRAQSTPYPGAFSYYDNQKIVIDWVEFSDFGFNSEIENGTIINKDPLIVKTTNGALKLTTLRNNTIVFEHGKKFHNENR